MVTLLNRFYLLVQDCEYYLLLSAVFVTAALIMGAVFLLCVRRNEFRDRLQRVLQEKAQDRPHARVGLVREETSGGFVARATAPLQSSVEPSDEAERGKIRVLLVQAGLRSKRAYRRYLALRGLSAFLFPLAYIVTVFTYRPSVQMILLGLVFTMAGFYLPLWVMRYLVRKRQGRISRALPDALDLMVVCAEAGLGLDLILRKVGEEIRPMSRDLSDEFFLTNLEIQAGKSRDEAFKNMGLRTGVPEVNSLLSILRQASRFGTSIAQTLRVHAEEMRIKRRQKAEERAAVLAVKMLFPMLIFIFPAIFIVLIGPAGIMMVRTLFPVLSGQGG